MESERIFVYSGSVSVKTLTRITSQVVGDLHSKILDFSRSNFLLFHVNPRHPTPLEIMALPLVDLYIYLVNLFVTFYETDFENVHGQK